jgi:2-keto-4-pentenoate hydratase
MALAVVASRNYSEMARTSQRIFEGAQSSVEHDFKMGLGSKLNSDVATNMAAPAGVARLSAPGGASGRGAIEDAAALLASARLSLEKLVGLPDAIRPRDVEAALEVQRTVGLLLTERIAGWKCALPSPGKVIIAPIYSGVVAEGLRWRLPTLGPTARLEPEVAVTLVRDLPPRNIPYDEAEVVNSVGSVRLALELLDCRYVSPERVSFEELLADGLFNAGLFLGPEVDGGLARDFARTQISLEVGGSSVQSLEGRHPDGNPVIPLHWLVNTLRERGAGLERGQVVITGSYAGVIEVPANAKLRIGFGGLGTIAVQLSSEE